MNWKEVVSCQLVNMRYWFFNCKCDCKSCYEMRKSIKSLDGGFTDEGEEE